MTVDRTQPDGDWHVAEPDGTVPSWERVAIAVLMDIRRELKNLNGLLNFIGIPERLRRIARNTAKPRREPAASARKGHRAPNRLASNKARRRR